MTDVIPNEVFSQMVKTVGERLKPLGFSKRGTVFRIMGPDMCGLIEFQRSMGNTREQLRFTVNLGVVCGELLELQSRSLELSKARVIDAQIELRIGQLLPDRDDKWWEITADTDPDVLSMEVTDMIVNLAVPYVRQYLDVNAIIALWESGQSPGMTDRYRVELLAALKAKRQGGA